MSVNTIRLGHTVSVLSRSNMTEQRALPAKSVPYNIKRNTSGGVPEVWGGMK